MLTRIQIDNPLGAKINFIALLAYCICYINIVDRKERFSCHRCSGKDSNIPVHENDSKNEN